jgi:ribosomal protein S18 acetylase RimI-like enzyme
MIFSIEGPYLGKRPACVPILRSLPEWFGIEESIINYSSEIDQSPTFLAIESEQVIGFLSLKQHNPYSAEILVMGILPEAHRRGIGRALIHEAQGWLRKQDVEYLQVKTLGPSNSDANYAKTRAFYLKMGFRPLEEFNQIWDENNPCLVLVKRI